MKDRTDITGFRAHRGLGHRRRESVTDSIESSRTTLVINMAIEAVCAVLLIVGFTYLLRFLFLWRYRMIDLYFRLFAGGIFFFASVWAVFLVSRLRKYYRRLRELSHSRG